MKHNDVTNRIEEQINLLLKNKKLLFSKLAYDMKIRILVLEVTFIIVSSESFTTRGLMSNF